MNHPFTAMGVLNNKDRRSQNFIRSLFVSFLVVLAVTACSGGGGGGGGSSAPSATTATISGNAVKGPIANGTVTAYAVTAAGSTGAVLGTTKTDANGAYSLTLNYTGAVLLEITGGSYIDEATGQTVNVPTSPGSGLQAAVSNVAAGSSLQVQITPLTTMASARAQAMTGGLTVSNIDAANQQVGTYFGGLDILNTQPINPLLANSATGATQNAINYGLILAGLSEEAQTLGLANPFDLVAALVKDFSDGSFNGASGSTPIQLNGSMMNPATGTTELGTGINTFSAGPSNVSGGTVSATLITFIDSPTSTISVPTVTGLIQAAAQSAIATAGLIVGTVTQASSTTVPAGNVIGESPAAGTNVASGSLVNLVVSTGPAPVAVPNVVGDTQATATTAITGAGLTVGTVTQAFSTTVPAGNVISENPTAGTSVAEGTAVNLNISSTMSPGTFSATGSMITPRTYHTATLLPNGKVLMAGGWNGGLTVIASAELYDPATGTFTGTGSMITARRKHTATLLPNGKVLMAGGVGSSGTWLGSAELYDPATGTFTATGTMIGSGGEYTATLLPNGMVLGTGTGGNQTELYNPATGTFSATGFMIANYVAYDTATLLPNGMVLVASGLNNNAGTMLQSAELYNPATGTFGATGNLITGRVFDTATLLANGTVLVAGGNDTYGTTGGGSGSTIASAELYDPATGTFTATGSMTTPRQEYTATLLANGTVLLAGGGSTHTTPSLMSFASAELYNPATGTFSATGSMTTFRMDHTATLLPNGTVLIAGGNNSASAELYQP